MSTSTDILERLDASPGGEHGLYPLSFAQERLWLLQQIDPENWAYNSRLALRLTGAVDIPALKASLDFILARHSVLRTRFVLLDHGPAQEILPSGGFPFRSVDLEDLPPEEREQETDRLVREETKHPFDLANGPLIRAMLIRLGDSDHLLSIDVHHIAADGSSLEVFARELAVLYDSFSGGRKSPLKPLPLNYADFARWERQRLRGPALDRRIRYWVGELQDCPVLQLPAGDVGRSPSSGGGCERFTIDAETSAVLLELGRKAGVSPFMLLVSIFGIFLYRYSGLRDIVLGTIVQNRADRRLSEMIGSFANLIPLRLRIRPERSFGEHLLAVRDVCLQAYAHQEAPFERVVEQLNSARNGLDQPLTDVIFTTALERPALQLGELEIRWLPNDSGLTRFGFFLSMRRTPRGLTGQIHYKTEKHSAETIRRMVSHWQTLLKSVAAAPTAGIRHLHVLTAAEQVRGVIRSDAPSSLPGYTSVAALFTGAAQRSPDRIAIECAACSVTYGELDRRSDSIAAKLAELGVWTDVPIGIYLERSAALVLAIVSVLKAGGAYVPLDPDYPVKRIATIISSSGIQLVLTSATMMGRLQEAGEARALVLEDLIDEDAGSTVPAHAGSHPEAAAYILHTSGSTGVPKAIAVTQQSLTNSLTAVGALLGMHAEDAIAALSTVTFDIAAVELLLPLLYGAKIVLAASVAGRNPEEHETFFTGGRISVAQATPSTWRLLLAAGCAPRRGMRLIAGGEALPLDLARELTVSGAVLWNGYGPTEATIYSTFFRFPGGPLSPAIGRPIANTTALILNEDLQMVPGGAAGELYLGGAGLSRGYWRSPRMTAERFVPDPFGAAAGALLYRTGDLARRRADGEIEYLGRADAQVKLRGNRIELGEIATTIRSFPGIRDCVVVLRRDDGGDYLAAYYVADPQTPMPRGELRRHIQAILPAYMVPAALVALPGLPLMPSGKVDKRALPAPNKEPEGAGTAPQGPIELELAAIWKDLLGLESVGADQNFFDLGGHSLLAMQVIVRARTAFGVAIPFRTLFEAQTIQALANRVERLQTASPARRNPPPLSRGRRPAEIPLSFTQQRLWMLDEVKAGSAAYTIAGGVQIEGELNVNALLMSIAEVVRRHEALRTVYPLRMGRPVQVIRPPSTADIEFITRFADPSMTTVAKSAAAYLESEARKPFDLAEGPVFRARLVRLSGNQHWLMVAMHHIAADGWSIALIIRELSALYPALANALPSPLPELRLQYADYAIWQRQWAEGENLQTCRGYWSSKLAGARGLVYPADRVCPDRTAAPAETVRFTLPAILANSLVALGRTERATLFALLLAGWKTLLFHHTGIADVVVGAPVANRGHQELEELVGCFINTLPLRTDLSGNPTFRKVLQRVAETCAGAFEHQELPYEQMVEAIRSGADAGDLVRMMFMLRNEPQTAPRFGDLEVRPLPIRRGAAKFDMVVDLREDCRALSGSIEYNAGIYDPVTIRRLARHYQALLEHVADDPDCRLDELDLETTSCADPTSTLSFPEVQEALLL